MRKTLIRLPQVIRWRLNYRRWSRLVGVCPPSWNVFVRELKNTARENHRRFRERAELEKWKDPQTVHQPCCTWLPNLKERRTPYVCASCGEVDDGRNIPLFVYQTMEVVYPDQTRSLYRYLTLLCLSCGLRTRDADSPYIPKGGNLRPPTSFHSPIEEKDVYHIRYTVRYGAYEGHRGQYRERGTHRLIETRAEVFRLDKKQATPDLRAQQFAELTVDDVPLGPGHPLHDSIIPHLKEYETERMAKYP